MKARAIVFVLAAAALAATENADAQSDGTPAARGVAAYRALEYDSAAILLRRALADSSSAAITGTARADALSYLGAAELFSGRVAQAAQAFAQILAIDPRYRVDELVFPPAVTHAFGEARLTTAYTTVRSARDTIIATGSRGLALTLFSSAPHDIVVTMVPERGGIIRRIYSGPIGDSLAITWNGMDSTDNTAVSGAFSLRVQSQSGATHGETTLRLQARPLPVDTLIAPPPPVVTSVAAERPARVPALRSLALGTIGGAAAIFLPELMGQNGSPMPERYIVGGTLAVAGVFGFLKGKQDGRASRRNTADATTYDAWRRTYESVQSENQKRRRAQQIRITAGAQTIRTVAGS